MRDTVCEVFGPNVPTTTPRYQGRVPLPIASVVRGRARQIGVRDQTQRPLPHMTRSDERRATARGMAQLALEAFRSLPLQGRMRRFETLETVILASIDPGYGHTEPLEEAGWVDFASLRFPDLATVVSRARESRTIFALAEPRALRSLSTFTEHHAETMSLREATILGALQAWWRSSRPNPSSSSLYFHWTRIEGQPVNSGHLTLTETDASAVQVDVLHDDDATSQYKRLSRSPYWAPDTFIVTYRLADILECQSYHLEVSVPPGVYIHRANLRIPNKSRSAGDSELVIVRDDDARSEHAHLHFSRQISRRGAVDRDYSSAVLHMQLRPTYHDGLRGGLNVSAVAMATLWILFAIVGWRSAGRGCLALCSQHFGELDTNSVVSLLILTPTVAIGLLVRKDEHELTKRVQGPLKLRLSLVAVVLFATALLTALNPVETTLFNILLVGATASTLLTLPTWLSASVSGRRLKRIAAY